MCIIQYQLEPNKKRYPLRKESCKIIALYRKSKKNIPKIVKFVYICKEQAPYNEIKGALPTNLDGYEHVYKNCVLIDNLCTIQTILCHRFYNNDNARFFFFKTVEIRRMEGGGIKWSITRKGKTMVMSGWKWDNRQK
jgi:hypothetical protein